ncbi:hypothetical protein NDR87_03135 [Nocardia sp. CDC159]|uniref:Uncharacterized protein n=1 Tax=Nocardia pulmonis TaxID=2951408 RepID=A0A9X2E0X9_9NOCA|nr:MULTISPECIES: hypothetical protein [Nocardia]MCM6771992.1 hypothetical protein [Nocardia pulmonis]MCM6785350.1 hypothetical protein [Nocardia sp. CDC159]
MNKIRTLGLGCVAAAAIVLGGTGFAGATVVLEPEAPAAAEIATTDAPTGSAYLVTGSAELLKTGFGSANGPMCPGGKCPK